MEIVNVEFRNELLFLDDEYGCLNTEWESQSTPFHFGDPDESIRRIPIVHFSSMVKPWQCSTKEIRNTYPAAHEVFVDLWRRWRCEMIAVAAQIARSPNSTTW